MPSDVIYGPGGVHTRVSWGTPETGQIQIVTQAVAGGPEPDPTERLIAIVNEWLKEAGEPTIDFAKLKDSMDHVPFFDGWWMILDDWGQVNRLIRTLKRARDRQFGEPA